MSFEAVTLGLIAILTPMTIREIASRFAQKYGFKNTDEIRKHALFLKAQLKKATKEKNKEAEDYWLPKVQDAGIIILKTQLKLLLTIFIPIIILFALIRALYSHQDIIILGLAINWFWYYFTISIVSSMSIRRIKKWYIKRMTTQILVPLGKTE